MNHPTAKNWLQANAFVRPTPGSILDEIERTDGSIVELFDGLDLEMLEEELQESQ